jgi:hypothetical protein
MPFGHSLKRIASGLVSACLNKVREYDDYSESNAEDPLYRPISYESEDSHGVYSAL